MFSMLFSDLYLEHISRNAHIDNFIVDKNAKSASFRKNLLSNFEGKEFLVN